VLNDHLIFRVHALQRMFERHISIDSIKKILITGETIEDYSAEMPEPGRLILGYKGKRPIHIVVSADLIGSEQTIITAYIPGPNKWKHGYRERN
jgi:hypothetical protein